MMTSLLYFALILALGLNQAEEVIERETDGSTPSSLIKQYMEDAIERVKLDLHKASLKYEHKRRARRSLNYVLQNSSFLQGKMLHISNIIPKYSIPTSYPLDLEPFSINNNQYIAVINHKGEDGNLNTLSHIYKINEVNGSFTKVLSVPTEGGVDFEYADFGMEKYLVFVGQNKEDWIGGQDIEKALFTGLPIADHTTRVMAPGARRVKSYISHYRHYFVTANYYDNYLLYGAKSTLRVKNSLGYQLIQTFETYGAEDVEIFVINGDRYIAFANSINNAKEVDIYSTIYKIKKTLAHQTSDQYHKFQSLLTHCIKDFEYFTMKGQHYLAASNYGSLIHHQTDASGNRKPIIDHQIDSVIYWWTGKLFIEYQRIPTNGANRIQSFNVGEDVALVVSNTKAQATVYVFDTFSGIFKPAETQGLSPYPGQLNPPDVRSVRAYSVNNMLFLAVANYNNSGGTNIFQINVTTVPTEQMTPGLREVVKHTLEKMQSQLTSMKSKLAELETKSEKLMLIDNNQTVTGSMNFRTVNVDGTLYVEKLHYKIRLENNPIEKAVEQSMRLKQRLNELQSRVEQINEKVSKTVHVDGNYTIDGLTSFEEKAIFRNVTSSKVQLSGLIDNTNLTDLEHRVWKKYGNQTFTAGYTFNEGVHIRKNLDVLGYINGLNIPEDIMNVNTAQNITGKKTFLSNATFMENITTRNYKINNISASEDVLLRAKDQVITGYKTFEREVTFNSNIDVFGLIDGVNFSDYVARAVMKSKNQTVFGKLIFQNGYNVNGNINVSGTVDGVNLTQLESDLVTFDKDQVIIGNKTFLGSLHIQQDLKTNSTVNEDWLQDAMTTHTSQVITSVKEFEDIYVQGDITTNSTIDGIRLSEQAVTTYSNQTIKGEKVFKSIVQTRGDILVTGLVDNVDISEWERRAVRLSKPQMIPTKKNFTGQVIIEKHLNISGLLNEINLKEFCKNIVTKDRNQTISANVTFKELKIALDLNLTGTLNGIRIPEDLVPLDENVTIGGTKMFKNDATFMKGINITAEKKLNEEILSDFAREVVLNGTNQTIIKPKTFLFPVHMEESLNVSGQINSMHFPTDVVLLDQYQYVKGKKNFTDGLMFEKNLTSFIAYVDELVNSVDLSELASNVVNIKDSSSITGSLQLAKNTTMTKNLTVDGQVNGIDIQELAKSVARLSKDQEIAGNKMFTTDIHLKTNVFSSGKISNVSIRELNNTLVKANQEQTITGHKIYLKSVQIDGNLNNGTINHINLHNFKNRTVADNEDAVVTGKLVFKSNVSFGSFESRGLIDGIDFKKDILKTSGAQRVYGHKVMQDGIKYDQTIIVEGKVDGVDISQLNLTALKIFGNQTVTGELIFKDGVTLHKDMDISGIINNVDISELKNETVHKNGTVEITGSKTFQGNMIFEGDVLFKESVNGVNLTRTFEDALYKYGNETVIGKKTFTGLEGIKINRLLDSNNISVSGLVDGVNLTDINKRMMTLLSKQVITGNFTFINKTYFENNITLKGLLNKVNISNIMTISGDQVVTGNKTFKHIIFPFNVTLPGTVDGVDLSDFAKSRVTLSSNQSITGAKMFLNGTIFTGNIKMAGGSLINGVDVGKEILSTDEDAIVVGRKVFIADLNVQRNFNVSNLVNDVDLRDLKLRSVSSNGNKTLRGLNTFEKNLTVAGNIEVKGFINGVKVREVASLSDDFSSSATETLRTLNCSARHIDAEVQQLSGFIESDVALCGFKRLSVGAEGNYGKAAPMIIDGNVFIAASDDKMTCSAAPIWKCDTALKSCAVHQKITTASDRFDVFGSNETYPMLFVRNNYANSTSICPKSPAVYRWDLASVSFSPQQVTKEKILQDFLQSEDIILRFDMTAFYSAALISYKAIEFSAISFENSWNIKASPNSISFKSNGLYLLSASPSTESNFLELYRYNTQQFTISKLQRIPFQHIVDFDVSEINGNIIVAVAEKRHYSNQVRVFIFEKEKLYFLQQIRIHATSVQIKKHGQHWYLAYAAYGYGFGLCPWRASAGFSACMSVANVGAKQITSFHYNCNSYAIVSLDTEWVLYQITLQGLPRVSKVTGDCYSS